MIRNCLLGILLLIAGFSYGLNYQSDALKKKDTVKKVDSVKKTDVYKEFKSFKSKGANETEFTTDDSIQKAKYTIKLTSLNAELEYQKLQMEISKYNQEALAIKQRAFNWQYVSSIIIFIVVIMTVLIGLFFAWKQFKLATDLPETDIDISLTGIKVKSSIMGVVILTISIVFFYLYLTIVYPINQEKAKEWSESYGEKNTKTEETTNQ